MTPPSAPVNVAPSDLWIVMPAYNEGRRIDETLHRLNEHGYRNIAVVDDGSCDDTGEKALAAGAWVLRHIVNCGAGAATQTGIEFALGRGAAVIVTFDADGQHCAEDVAAMAAPIQSGEADFTIGSRFLGKTIDMPVVRKMVLKAGALFTRIVSGISVSDGHNGFRGFSRAAAHQIHLTQNRFAHASELLDQVRAAGLRLCEVPVTVRYTADTLAKGQSSWNALKIAVQLLLGRFVR
jgi:glycosyltransferase involved in cell wall biosynthesis